jgi:hypothetical protein
MLEVVRQAVARLKLGTRVFGRYRFSAPLFSFALCRHPCSTSNHAMACATGDMVDQQLKDYYGKLGLHRDTDDSQRPRLRTNGSCNPSPTL